MYDGNDLPLDSMSSFSIVKREENRGGQNNAWCWILRTAIKTNSYGRFKHLASFYLFLCLSGGNTSRAHFVYIIGMELEFLTL